jgi:hypothetical protein
VDGELPELVYEALFGPAPAWSRSVEPGATADVRVPAPVAVQAIATTVLRSVPAMGFLPAEVQARGPDPDPGGSATSAWVRDGLAIVAFVSGLGTWSVIVGPRAGGQARGAPVRRAWDLLDSDAASAAFGAFPVAGSDLDALTAALRPYTDEFETHLAPLLEHPPVDLAALAQASQEVIDRLRGERYRAYSLARAEAAWQDGRYATYLDHAEAAVEWGADPPDPQRVLVAKAHPRERLRLPDGTPEDTAGRLRAALELFRAVDAEMDAAIAHRDDNAAAWATWEEATRRWADALSVMLPDGAFDPVAVRAGDPEAIDRAISFLEVDPWFHRSGYLKDDLVRALRQVDLGPGAATRLRVVLLAVTDVGDRREFRGYCRLARRIADEALVAALLDRLRGDDVRIARRALWMLDALRVPLEGDDRRRVQAILEQQASGPPGDDWYQVERWVGRFAARYRDDTWVATLLDRGCRAGAPDAGALRLLTRVGFTPSDEQRSTLRQLVLDRVIEGGDLTWMEAMASMVDSPEARAELVRAYRQAPDAGARTRAWWAIRGIQWRAQDGWPGNLLDT